MGEIADALKKAQDTDQDVAQRANQTDAESPRVPGEISEALRQSELLAPAVGTSSFVEQHAQNDAPAASPVSNSNFEIVDSPNLETAFFHVERHRHLGLSIRTELDRRGVRSVAVVSAMRNEGKTTVACNLAAAMSSLGSTRSVALVDLDLRSPSIAERLAVPVEVGLELVLQGRAKLDDARIQLRAPEIDVYACSQPYRAAHELLVQPAFRDLIRELESRYSAVVIDTPPTLIVPDATLIMRHAGACIAIARMARTKTKRFTEMLERLPEDRLLGTVLNNSPMPTHEKDDYYYYYGEQ